jgi:hypothetical protein
MLSRALGDDLRHRLGRLILRQSRSACEPIARGYDLAGVGGRELFGVASGMT